ncbi:MAG TPA: CRTAC1 family protein [Chthoniobacteraceae bacterium]|jgi:hypothetical protein|nr:CRTAC1 family protein [Chthoniobacteraceae bacterium]
MSNFLRFSARCFACLALLACGAAGAGEPAFTDITKESGVEQVVADRYAKVPKWWLSGMDLVDLTGSGHLDLVLGGHGQQGVIALNDGKGHFTTADAPGLSLTEIHVACDVTGSRRLDLQLTHSDGGGRWFFNESKAGALSFNPATPIPGQARENAMIDLDRDGFVDWIHEQGDGLQVEFGDGHGSFPRHDRIPGLKETSAIPIDLNGDGWIDLVLKQCGYHAEKTGMCRILLNDGTGKSSNATEACGLIEEGLVIQGVGDVNQDGSPDLICLDHGKTVEIYLNDGKGHFTRLPDAVSGLQPARRPTYANWGIAVVTDFDNDGVADILMNGRNFLYVLRGTGGGRFAYVNREWGIEDASWSAVDEGLCFGDIDGDGDLDIVGSKGSENRKSVAVYRNDLPAQHWLNVRAIGAPGNRCAAGAKIRVLEPGTGKLLWFEQVVIAGRQSAHSYYATPETERHFGLGARTSVDVAVEFYPSGKVVKKGAVATNGTVEVEESGPAGS